MNKMAGNDYIETFIYKYKYSVYIARLNFTKKTYSVHLANGKLVFRREHLARLDMTAIFKDLKKYNDQQGKLKFFRRE